MTNKTVRQRDRERERPGDKTTKVVPCKEAKNNGYCSI